MEDKNYYTPEITEFHLGYEYEYFNESCNGIVKIDFSNNTSTFSNYEVPVRNWIKTKLELPKAYSPDGVLEYLNAIIDSNQVRTKYLDENDILSLGFASDLVLTNINYIDEFISGFVFYFGGDRWIELIKLNDNVIKITLKYFKYLNNGVSQEWKVLFEGTCKSKNELKTILKLIQ